MDALGSSTYGIQFRYQPVGNVMLIFTDNPGECSGCGLPRTSFVNRQGRSLCVSCDMAANGGRHA